MGIFGSMSRRKQEKAVQEMAEVLSKERRRSRAKRTFCVMAIVVFAILAIGIWIGAPKEKDRKVISIVESSLKGFEKVSEFSAIDYPYNAVVTKKDDKGNDMYHVAYEGHVTMEMDFSKISFEEKEKTIFIYLPDVEAKNPTITPETLEYIYENKKYQKEALSKEILELCKKDLRKRIDNESRLYDTAKENARITVESFCRPLIEEFGTDYSLKVVFDSERDSMESATMAVTTATDSKSATVQGGN